VFKKLILIYQNSKKSNNLINEGQRGIHKTILNSAKSKYFHDITVEKSNGLTAYNNCSIQTVKPI
jgi:hypothetical protein